MLPNIIETLQKAYMKWSGLWRVAQLAKTSEELRLDLGCGSSRRPGFVGLDLSPYADIPWDILWGLPFEDSSVAEISSDHFFEHLALPNVVEVLRECHRVLIPGGVLAFTVPHFDPYVEAYLRRDLDFLRERIFDVPDGQDHLYSTCFDRIAWLLHRAGEHKSLFDRESILHKVRLAGFSDVRTRELEAARDFSRRFSSVCVVATK